MCFTLVIIIIRYEEDQERDGVHDKSEFLHMMVTNSIEETVAIV